MRARVNRYVNSGDPEDVLDPAGLRDAESLLTVIDELRDARIQSPVPWIDAYQAVGLLHHARHLARPDTVDREHAESLLAQVHDWVPELGGQLRELAEVPRRPVRLSPRRVAVSAYAGSPLGEVDAVITGIRHAIRKCRDWPESLALRMDLAEAQHLRFGRTGDAADLSEAIATARAVARETAAYDPAYPERLGTLGEYLQARYASTVDLKDLDAAIEAYQRAVDGTAPDDARRGDRLSALSRAYRARHAANRDPADGAAALRTAQAAATAASLLDRAGSRGRGA